MARTKLDIGKLARPKTGKTYINYDVMLLAEDGNPLVTISIYKESGMTEEQKEIYPQKTKINVR